MHAEKFEGSLRQDLPKESPRAAQSKLVGLDIRALSTDFKAHALRGTGRYVSELCRNVGSSDLNDSSSCRVKVQGFTPNDLQPEDLISSFLEGVAQFLPFGKVTFRQQLCYPRRLHGGKAAQFDLLHFPAHIDAPSWCKKKYVVTVLDLIPLVLKDLYSVGKPTWRYNLARYLELQAIKNATAVLTISKHGARDVERLLGVPAERIFVTELGIDQQFFGQHLKSKEDEVAFRGSLSLPTDKQIVLYVGGIDQRKNIVSLVKSFEIAVERIKAMGKATPILVVAGAVQGDLEYPKLQQLINQSQIKEKVFFTGFLKDQDLMKLYQTAAVFFFPSLYEGFGFTPLEAMACGAAVVSSDRSSMPEVLGDAALFVDPEDHQMCAEKLAIVLTDQDRSLELRKLGFEQARKFPWSKTVEKTLLAYERALSI